MSKPKYSDIVENDCRDLRAQIKGNDLPNFDDNVSSKQLVHIYHLGTADRTNSPNKMPVYPEHLAGFVLHDKLVQIYHHDKCVCENIFVHFHLCRIRYANVLLSARQFMF